MIRFSHNDNPDIYLLVEKFISYIEFLSSKSGSNSKKIKLNFIAYLIWRIFLFINHQSA